MTAPDHGRRSATRLPRELSPTAKLVYLYLAEYGGANVQEPKESLGVPRLRLYPVLDALDRWDLVDRSGDDVTLRQ